jgi:hypothetical protein
MVNMKIYYLAYFSVFLSLSTAAQINQSVAATSSDITDILTNKSLQTSVEIAKETSKLEDLNDLNMCPSQLESHESCQGFGKSLLDKNYKDEGWKTLLEIKYQAVDPVERRSLASANYRSYNFNTYRNHSGDAASNISSAEELEAETQQIKTWYQNTWGINASAFDIRTQLIIDQLTNPAFTSNDAEMMSKIKNYSSSMNDADFTRFISSLAGYVDYNNKRAAFQQTEDGGLGIVTPFDQFSGSKSGVCGDIHSMAAKAAEQRGWEAFTVGYALKGNQHVVTAMVNPNDPDKLMIVNYGTYEEQTLNEGNSITPTPSKTGWEEMGTQMRIFKNKKTGDGLGKMQQIATVPTSLGTFMTDLFKRENQISKVMPGNENYRKEQVGFKKSENETNVSDDSKITNKFLDKGIVIYEGQTENAQIYGVAVSRDVYKDLYRWDPEEGKCVLKKNKYFSLGVATSFIGINDTDATNFYAYLNIKGGQIFHVYQTEHFQFKGIIGYEFDGFLASSARGPTGDANFATLMGVAADYNKNKTSVHLGLNYEANIALRNQNLMTDLSSLPKNLNPIGFNAISLDANATQKLGSKTSLVTNNKITMTRVGGRVLLSTGIIHNNTSLMASYQGGVTPLPIGNTLQNVNLLQNFNNMDGFRLSASQNFSSKKGNLSGTVSGYGGISTSTVKPLPMAGASLKLNLDGKKKRKPSAIPE